MKTFLSIIGLLAVLGAIFGAGFFFGGFFNVAASQDDPDIVNWAIVHVRDASIGRHATDHADGLARRSSAGPGRREGLLAAWLRELSRRAGHQMGQILGRAQSGAARSQGRVDDPPEEIFWVIKNGIKMTGMPSFGKIEVPDPEIWSMVAFLKKLPAVSEDDYKAWTGAAPAAKP